MVYKVEVVLLAEIGVEMVQVQAYTPTYNEAVWMEKLDLVEEKWDHATYKMEQYRG